MKKNGKSTKKKKKRLRKTGKDASNEIVFQTLSFLRIYLTKREKRRRIFVSKKGNSFKYEVGGHVASVIMIILN